MNSGSEYTVNYVKRTDLTYTVNYYWNGTTQELAESKEVKNQTFEATVTESPITIDDYTPVSTDPQTITIKVVGNVINFYYYKNVKLTANSDTVFYNGSEQSVSGFTVSGDTVTQKAVFEGITVGAKGTDVTTDTNKYPATFAKDPVGTVDKTEKYIVTEANDGELTINKRPVTIRVNTKEFTYDGKPKTVADGGKEYKVDAAAKDSGLVAGHSETLDVAYGTDNADNKTLVGVYEAKVKGDVVTISSGSENVTANYAITLFPGKLTISDERVAPSLVVTKTHEDGTYDIGNVVTFTITVKNIYDAVKTITIEEIEGVTLAKSVFENVQPGETVTTTATYTIIEADILRGEFVNTVTATFSDEDVSFEATDTALTVPMEAKYEKTKITLGVLNEDGNSYTQKEFYKLNDEIWYKITVENTGNVTYTNLMVEDSLTGLSKTIASLAPGKTEEFFTSYKVTESDVLKGSVENYAAVGGGTTPTPAPSETPRPLPVPTPTPNPSPTPDTKDEIEEVDVTLNVKKTVLGVKGEQPELYTTKEAYKLGDVVFYKIEVTNAGNVTYTNVVVTDAKTGMTNTVDSLQVGSNMSCITSHVVTSDDIIAGEFVNVANAVADEVQFPDGTTKRPEGKAEATITTEAVNVGMTVVKKSSASKTYELGETIEYTITVTNTGNVPYDNVVVKDELAGATIKSGTDYKVENGEAVIAKLGVGQSALVYAEYTVTEGDILNGTVVNNATAKADPVNGKTPEAEGRTEDDTDDVNSRLTVTKTTTSTPANGTTYALGETIEYKIVVENDGNVTISNIEVIDSLSTAQDKVIGTIDKLAPAETKEFTFSYVVTEDDILAGKVVNEATATGEDPEDHDPEVKPGQTEDDTDKVNSRLTVTKTTTSTPANGKSYALGETIEYKIVVENDGNVTISNIEVTDILSTAQDKVIGTIDKLAPAETKEFTFSYVVTEDDILAGKVVNEATATGEGPEDHDPEVKPGQTEDDTDKVNSHLTVTKTTTSTPANGTTYALGETIEYKIVVENDGNVTISNIEVIDSLSTAQDKVIGTIDKLAPAETKEFTFSYVVTEDDILAGEVVNEATATGTDPKQEEPTVTPGEVKDPTEAKKPSLFVRKVTTTTPANGEAYALGETIGYKIVVINNGNVTIRDITVVDDLTKAQWDIDELEPGATSDEFTTEYVVTEADILAGKVLNVATATGKAPDVEEPIKGSGDKEVETDDPNPNMTIEKTLTNLPAKGYFTVGETAEFEITVTNTGNLTLKNVTVSEDLEGATILSGDGYSVTGNEAVIATLAPYAKVVVKASYTITENDLGEEIYNIATVSADGPEDPEDPTKSHDPEDKSGEEEIPTDDLAVVAGVKTWIDQDNAFATRPETITIRLLADGQEIGSTTASAPDWSYDFGKLPAHTAEGEEIAYDVAEDAVVGYDTAYAEDGYDITNSLQRYTLTIRYWYDEVDGTVAAPTVSNTYYYGESYNVASPAIDGYSASMGRVSGIMEGDAEYDVIYTINSYTLTVRYIFQDGTTAAPDYLRTLLYGDFYMHDSPVLSGYTASQRVVLGTMPGRNMVYTVIYVPDTVDIVIDEYGVPLGIGNVEMNVGDCFE